MEQQNKQIIDYIGQHLSTGHSEAQLRQHLLAYGWTEAKTESAFTQYRASQQPIAPRPATASAGVQKKLRKGGRPKLAKWSAARVLKLGTALAVLAAVAVGAHSLLGHHSSLPVVEARPLTYEQRQTTDVNTIAGAIGQYAFANNALPTRLSVGNSTEALVMCNTVCDPTTSQIDTLIVYKAANVIMQPYTANLKVPNEQTVYLVAAAKCASGQAIGGPNAKPRSMILLYAALSGQTLSPRCITL